MSDIPADAVRETWENMHDESVRLAEMIRDSGEGFDAIVVVPRGSYYPANIIARELGFEAVDLLHAAVSSYEIAGTGRGELKLGQMPSDAEVAGKNLLIIDDICDSGQMLGFLTERFKQQGAKQVRSGVLHYKPSADRDAFKPDWFVAEANKWIVYPWELHDTKR